MKFLFRIFLVLICVVLLTSCKSRQKQTDAKSKLSEKEQMDFSFLYMNASKELILGNYPEAAKLFEKCIQLDGTNPAPMYELGKIYFQKNDLKYAEFLLKAAAEFEPQNYWYQYYYAEVLKKGRKYGEVVKVYNRLTKIYPSNPDYYYELASAYLYLGKFENALDVYSQLEKMMGITEDICVARERIYLRQNKFDKAISEVQKLIAFNPSEMRYHAMLAELYLANGYNDKALAAFNEALKIAPNNPYLHLSISDFYREIQDKKNYFSELLVAFKSEELDIDTKVKILLSFYTLSESSTEYRDESYKLLDALVSAHPKDAKAYSFYGDFLYRDGKTKEARTSYLKAIEYDNSKLLIWNQILFIDNDLNEFAVMDTHSVQAIELFPNEASLYLLNGIANIQIKKNGAAISILNKGLPLVVDNNAMLGQFYANLGDCYYRNKQMQKSDSSYDKALDINPNDVYVLNNYSYYLSLRNDKMDKAEAMSKKSNEIQPNSPSYEDTYAWILYGSKKYEEAKIWLEKALQHGGDKNPIILEHYGDLLFKLNMPEKALEYWIKAKASGEGSDFLERKINEKKIIE